VDANALVVESPSVPPVSPAHSTLIAVILFLASHFAMLVGVTSPEKSAFAATITLRCLSGMSATASVIAVP
jgi:hypothetical protein